MSRSDMTEEAIPFDDRIDEHIEGVVVDDSSDSNQGDLPSSPPGYRSAEVGDENQITMDRQRSHDDMKSEAEERFPSSATMVGDPASSALPSKAAPSRETEPSTAAHTMLPPPVPATSEAPRPFYTPAEPQQSEAETRKPLPASPPAKPPSEQQWQSSLSTRSRNTTPETQEILESPDDPGDQISTFDWDDLSHRYHSRMQELSDQEQKVTEEFESLTEYFYVWADAGSSREVDRSFKRLKTQEAYVQHEESELETKRQHYITVVDAFRSALALLTAAK